VVAAAFAVGCGVSQESSSNATEDQNTEQGTSQAGGQTTQQATQTSNAQNVAQSASVGNTGEAILDLKGDAGVQFSGSCTVGDGIKELNGHVPESYTFQPTGQRLDCEIRNESSGNLAVTFSAGGNNSSVQQSSTQGGTIRIVYENGSVSSYTTLGSGQVVQQSANGSSSVAQQQGSGNNSVSQSSSQSFSQMAVQNGK
jgi:hypothetical protein